MSNLYTKIKIYLDRDFDHISDVLIQNDSDGKGEYIRKWNVAEEQPTEEQLDALDAQATIIESNNQVDLTRRTAYGSWNDQLDEIYHDIDAWKSRLQTIKTNNPKS